MVNFFVRINLQTYKLSFKIWIFSYYPYGIEWNFDIDFQKLSTKFYEPVKKAFLFKYLCLYREIFLNLLK
jgi:hypothetical protein